MDAGSPGPDVIVIGTDPSSKSGGIGVVLPGYLQAIVSLGLRYVCIPTYHPTQAGGRWNLWLRALPKIVRSVRLARHQDKVPVVYSHAGAAPSMLREAMVLRVARLAGARTVMHLHASHIDSYLESGFAVALLRILLSRIDTVVVLTDWWRQRLIAASLHPRIAVVPNPLLPELEASASSAARRLLPAAGPITVISMARLVEGKGIDVAIRAIALLPHRLHLVVAGDGPLRAALEELAEALGVRERITFRGWISGAEKRELLDGAHVFCLPSTKDSFPIAMVEAMSHGLPVVAVRWGGIPEVVPDGRAGILTDADDPQQIADAILRLVESPTVYDAMTRDAKLCALEICSPKTVAARLGALFSVLNGAQSHA
jgi:glycosyltransferase involved in cell wall biosynthesis